MGDASRLDVNPWKLWFFSFIVLSNICSSNIRLKGHVSLKKKIELKVKMCLVDADVEMEEKGKDRGIDSDNW